MMSGPETVAACMVGDEKVVYLKQWHPPAHIAFYKVYELDLTPPAGHRCVTRVTGEVYEEQVAYETYRSWTGRWPNRYDTASVS